MDLKAAYQENARAYQVTRIAMVFCFALTGAILIASLALATPLDHRSEISRPASSVLR
jgi:hypothetical protein